MFESKHEPLASTSKFVMRLSGCITIGFFFMLTVILIGMLGYRFLENMDWIDAFTNSAMTIADMGLVIPVHTDSGKVFAAIYALLSGLVFFTFVGIVFAPIAHRIIHKFHIGEDVVAKSSMTLPEPKKEMQL
jgi:hypothetical protein